MSVPLPAEVGDVVLHYVEAGEGPLVVLLHGFPEFWYGWRQQIAPLVKAGFRVVAPDLRGYNLSSGPDGVAAYTADKLAGDIRGLIRELGAEPAMVVGHDWGGTVAWTLAANHPSSRDCPSAVRAAGTGGSSSASCATPARRTRSRRSIATSKRGPSQERQTR